MATQKYDRNLLISSMQVHSSKSSVKKFNYLRSFLADDTQHAISGLGLAKDNYHAALTLLRMGVLR